MRADASDVETPAPVKADVHVFAGAAVQPSLPARDLQAMLDARLAEPGVADAGPKWSARRTIAFAVGASSLLWAMIGAGVYLALHTAG